MSDIVLANCCGVTPVGQLDGNGSAYIVCPKCKRRSPSFSVHNIGVGTREIVDRKQAELAADAWNKTVKENMVYGK